MSALLAPSWMRAISALVGEKSIATFTRRLLEAGQQGRQRPLDGARGEQSQHVLARLLALSIQCCSATFANGNNTLHRFHCPAATSGVRHDRPRVGASRYRI